jgi:large subunit ribosomal protein L10
LDEAKVEPRPEKVAVVKEVRNRLDQASAAILTEYRGLTVKDLATLRRSLRDAGGEYRIYKNTLVRFAVRDLGLDELVPLLEGPTAIAFVDGDAVPVAKALRDYARTNVHLVVKGGVLGTKVMTSAETAALADLPPRELMLARFAGALAAPMVQFAGLLQALPRNFAYGLKALIDKIGPDGSEGEGPAAADSTPPLEPPPPPPPEAAVAEPEAVVAPEVVDAVPVGADSVADSPPEIAEPVAGATPAAEPEVAEPEAIIEPEAVIEPEVAEPEFVEEAAVEPATATSSDPAETDQVDPPAKPHSPPTE